MNLRIGRIVRRKILHRIKKSTLENKAILDNKIGLIKEFPFQIQLLKSSRPRLHMNIYIPDPYIQTLTEFWRIEEVKPEKFKGLT